MHVRPDIVMAGIERLEPALLARHGLAGLLVDLDETLVPAGSVRPHRRIRGWADAMRRAGIPILIVSNGTPARVRAVAGVLGIDGMAMAGKPWRPAFRRGLARLGLPASRVAMVGDQLFTDVLGARHAGLRTVLVPPLSRGGLPHTRLLRGLEARLLNGGEHGRPVHR